MYQIFVCYSKVVILSKGNVLMCVAYTLTITFICILYTLNIQNTSFSQNVHKNKNISTKVNAKLCVR